MHKIIDIARKIGLNEDDIELYGKYIAKIDRADLYKQNSKGKLILVSAMTPTTSGEGKTTVSIGLCDALNLLESKAVLSLREPSLGPVFGMKGGATGGGKAVIEPSNEINLHFTGDMHAITSANNLLCAMLDNSIFHGNPLNIDQNQIFFKRCMDMNDRSLREIEISLEPLKNQTPRKDGFVITAASEIMALLCLAKDFQDLKDRLGKIIVALSKEGKPIYAKDLNATDSMAALLTQAIKPNLVQTGEGNPAIVHGGPFANIAHGCSSVIATKTALSLGDFVITEGGFGADLGGEKFMDIVCRQNQLNPALVVLVATVKAIKAHSEKGELEDGIENLKKHIENFQTVFNQRVLVAINRFNDDSEDDLNKVKMLCQQMGVAAEICNQFAEGGKGALKLAKKAKELASLPIKKPNFPYALNENLTQKIEKLAQKIYGADKVEYSSFANEEIKNIEKLCQNMPIVVAKTQYSLSDDPKLIGAPQNTTLHVSGVELKNGSGFVVVKTGKMTLMPGLSKEPNAFKIKVDEDMKIYNLK